MVRTSCYHIIVGIFFVLGLILTGCGGEEAVEKKSESGASTAVVQKNGVLPAEAQKPVYGGRIIEPMLGDAVNLIPFFTSDSASHNIASQIYVSPLRYNKNIELEPWGAESYEVLDEGKRIRITMRKDLKWYDGEPVTAHDVEFTYKLMVNPDTPTPYADDFLAISEFKVIDDYTFEAIYDEVFARALITWALEILPEHVLEKENLLDTKYSREPMGAGPYKLKEWVAGSRIVLEANDTYSLGRPYLDQAVYKIIPDQGTQFLELKAGNLDFMSLTPKQYLYQTKGSSWDAFNKYKYLSFGYAYLGYNLRNPLFADKNVRKALAYAIDKKEIVAGVLFGLGVPAMGPYKPGTWVYNDKLKPYGYNPDKARDMLAKAGWKDTDGDGLLDRNGTKFEFTILTNQGNEQRIKSATIIQQRLKQIGISVQIRTVEWAAFLNDFVHKGNFDALMLGWNILQDPDIFSVWHSSQFGPKGLNHTFYSNAELDELLVAGRKTLDQSKRKQIYDRVQEILHEDQPYCFLYVPYSLPIVHSRFQGVKPAPAGIGYNFEQWWVPGNLQRFSISR